MRTRQKWRFLTLKCFLSQPLSIRLRDRLRNVFADRVATMNALMQRPSVLQLTYQDIILDNPLGDMRRFTGEETGLWEARFYRGHQLIENSLALAIASMKNALTDPANALICLNTALNLCQGVGAAMRSFATDLPKEHFQGFKPFFDTNPYTQEKGPSGAFTAKVPHIDILLYGREAPPDTFCYLEDNKKYFPRSDYDAVMEDGKNSKGVIELVEGGAKDVAIEIGRTMIRFRSAHRGAVHKHIGKNAMGSAEGSGADRFLQDRIASGQDALKKYAP